eukprot:2107384-Amphidinium_carterae.1
MPQSGIASVRQPKAGKLQLLVNTVARIFWWRWGLVPPRVSTLFVAQLSVPSLASFFKPVLTNWKRPASKPMQKRFSHTSDCEPSSCSQNSPSGIDRSTSYAG